MKWVDDPLDLLIFVKLHTLNGNYKIRKLYRDFEVVLLAFNIEASLPFVIHKNRIKIK